MTGYDPIHDKLTAILYRIGGDKDALRRDKLKRQEEEKRRIRRDRKGNRIDKNFQEDPNDNTDMILHPSRMLPPGRVGSEATLVPSRVGSGMKPASLPKSGSKSYMSIRGIASPGRRQKGKGSNPFALPKGGYSLVPNNDNKWENVNEGNGHNEIVPEVGLPRPMANHSSPRSTLSNPSRAASQVYGISQAGAPKFENPGSQLVPFNRGPNYAGSSASRQRPRVPRSEVSSSSRRPPPSHERFDDGYAEFARVNNNPNNGSRSSRKAPSMAAMSNASFKSRSARLSTSSRLRENRNQPSSVRGSVLGRVFNPNEEPVESKNNVLSGSSRNSSMSSKGSGHHVRPSSVPLTTAEEASVPLLGDMSRTFMEGMGSRSPSVVSHTSTGASRRPSSLASIGSAVPNLRTEMLRPLGDMNRTFVQGMESRVPRPRMVSRAARGSMVQPPPNTEMSRNLGDMTRTFMEVMGESSGSNATNKNKKNSNWFGRP